VLTLYGSRGSGSAAIEAALAVAGVPCEHVEGAEWNRTEGYERLKRVNPLAQIPSLVLEDGREVGLGTHHELLAGCPTYAEIVASQMSQEEAA